MYNSKIENRLMEQKLNEELEADNQQVCQPNANTNVSRSTVEVEAPFFDKYGTEIKEFALIKVFHFIGQRKKRHYMYKWVRIIEHEGKKYWYGQHLNDASGFFENPKNKWSGYRLRSCANSERKLLDSEIVQQYD